MIWINDKAPKESGLYLTTIQDVGKTPKYVVLTKYEIGKGWLTQFDVLAWMPLPEAWEGEKDE